MLKITTFTDPMMGLSYETEPFFRQLETHFEGKIQFDYVMAGLVKNVYDFVDPADLAISESYAVSQYLPRLARIYKAEESISGMPINITPENLNLFATDRTSSLPLCLAYHSAKLSNLGLAEAFLYRLRYATIVDVLPTTQWEVLLNVAEQTGLNVAEFIKHYQNGSAEQALQKDLALTK